MEQREAALLAERFGKENIPQWEEWGCHVLPADRLHLPGHYVFIYPPRADSGVRLGGNWPILVDERTGECRFARGVDEYRKMKAARPL
ncbi:hypothetical protein AMK26_12070 [Streptomyces sp. CB03234]|nr:hypothetical protein AMK26_12070 [Streptomyces sp. CB03234]